MKLLHQIVAGFFFYLALLLLGLGSLSWNLISYALYPFLPRERALKIGRAAIAGGYRLFWWWLQVTGVMRLSYDGIDELNRDAGLIIAPNHPTALDALLVVARVPRGVCIMRASLMQNPFLGAGARLARYIRNDPPSGMVRGAVNNLKAGGQLVMFPEGTRTVTAPVNHFLPGLTLIAHKAGVPIQTVIVDTETGYLGKGWPVWKPPHFPMVYRVRLGERFAPDADHQGLSARLEDYFRRELRT
ncbi:MAG: lysophospholipid acyltransferase family protein [Rhizobacter sp.]